MRVDRDEVQQMEYRLRDHKFRLNETTQLLFETISILLLAVADLGEEVEALKAIRPVPEAPPDVRTIAP